MKPDLCKEFAVRLTANGFLVETPLSYLDNDRIVVYATLQDDGDYRLSDNGEAAERLMLDGIDTSAARISEWLRECQVLRGVQWEADQQELWMVIEEARLAKAIFTLAETAAQLQAMTAMRSTRVDSTFKDEVMAILRDAAEATGIALRTDVSILPGNHFTADAYFASARPLAIIVAGSRERLLEAELLWSTAKRSGDPTLVYAVIENSKAVGLKETERANYFTDKVLPFRDFAGQFRSTIVDQIKAA